MKLSNDIVFEITKDLNMFDICKFSYVHPDIYEQCQKNDIWYILYNALFERRVISKNSNHIGPVTWFNCRCTSYPGWSKIHDNIDNSEHICKNINHYTRHHYKITKHFFKNYKNQTKKRYKYLLKNDSFIKSRDVYNQKMYKLEKELQNIKYKLNQCNNGINIINS